MDFGEVLLQFRTNCAKMTRAEWKGKKYIVLQPGYLSGVTPNENTKILHGLEEDDKIVVHPHIQMMRADGSLSVWVPKHEDLLANDWARHDE